jgi:hypothetical protein
MVPITSEAKEKGMAQSKPYISIAVQVLFMDVPPAEDIWLGLFRTFNE